MKSPDQQPQIYLLLIRLASFLVPAEFRSEWRREWQAEVVCRWLLLEKRGTLNTQTKFDLWKRVRGAVLDALWFQRAHLLLVMLNLTVAALTAFGAVQEFIVRAFLKPQTEPLIVSVVAISVSCLFMTSGIAMWRQRRNARRLIFTTGVLSILLHVYGVLPPHRTMGYIAFLVGAGYGLLMLVVFEWQHRRNLIS
jgi:hypothetical protein